MQPQQRNSTLVDMVKIDLHIWKVSNESNKPSQAEPSRATPQTYLQLHTYFQNIKWCCSSSSGNTREASGYSRPNHTDFRIIFSAASRRSRGRRGSRIGAWNGEATRARHHALSLLPLSLLPSSFLTQKMERKFRKFQADWQNCSSHMGSAGSVPLPRQLAM